MYFSFGEGALVGEFDWGKGEGPEAATVVRRYVHTDPASYAQNLSEILCTYPGSSAI